MKMEVNIIGAGLAGLSAAITLARLGIHSNLISVMPSERSQSVMAEGGINGAADTMGENDSVKEHFEDTIRSGAYIADETAVRGLTENAPFILDELKKLGVPFNLRSEKLELRNFGGQKKKRTAYSRSSTGKVLMTALIDEARKYEEDGFIFRYSRHELLELLIKDECSGVVIKNTFTNELTRLNGPVILAFGGMNGLFPGMTTGTLTNSGEAAALCFSQGVKFSNLEMIQYHPTTVKIPGKRCLISEAARGEGGRLFIMRNDKPWYFMEEKYPEGGNLMPRDVVSREMIFTSKEENCQGPVMLDMTGLSDNIWTKKLPDLRKEIIHYLKIDPAKKPVPVEPGIHYFMGGIDVDAAHRTNIKGLYAAGECCSQYHGANRLGGNSTLGAIYGGRVAAVTIAKGLETIVIENIGDKNAGGKNVGDSTENHAGYSANAPEEIHEKVFEKDCLTLDPLFYSALGIVRNEKILDEAIEKLSMQTPGNKKEKDKLNLAMAILRSAAFRKESRGAQYRSDYPAKDDTFLGLTTAYLNEKNEIEIGFKTKKI